MTRPKLPKPRKRFGQHFLHDDSVIENILHLLAPKKNDLLIEIGPGQGVLTSAVLDAVNHLYAIEIDRDLAADLEEQFKNTGKFTLFVHDVLKFDFKSLYTQYKLDPQQKLRIFGNLPYNISTPLLFHLLNYKECIQDMHFMLQKEVVERITAKPNTKAYGRLTILLNYFCRTENLFEVPPEAFTPPPKVDSAVIRLLPFKTLPYETPHVDKLKEITLAAFSKRRKTIQNALKGFLTLSDFEALRLDPQLRPEQFSIEEYVKMADYLGERNNNANN